MKDKIRADVALVQQGYFESREKAQASIMAGVVYIGEQRISKSSDLVSAHPVFTIRGSATPYASRGGLKLEKALDVFSADVSGKICMDIGAATGGFTDVLLQRGAAHVYAIDVGYGQFDWKLRQDPRVTLMERTNARYLTEDQLLRNPTVTVMDVSFISILQILPAAAGIMGAEGVFYTLIKPQFEAGRGHVGKHGVVRDASVHEDVLQRIIEFVPSMCYGVTGLDYSPITGPKGNIEFLAQITAGVDNQPCTTPAAIADLVRTAHGQLMK